MDNNSPKNAEPAGARQHCACGSAIMKGVLPALLVALGLLGLGFAIKAGIDNFTYRDRVVQVRGLAERTVKANQVTWPVDYAITGDDLATLYAETKQKNEVLIAFLTSNGIGKDEIQVNPPSVYNTETDSYGNNYKPYKYKLTSSMTVLTDKVDQVRELLNRQGELLTKGIAFSNSYISYEFTELNSIKPEMIAEATKNARKAADQFASDSQSHLGKIKSAEQGYFSIEDTDSSTPYIKNVRVVTNVTFYLED